MKVKKISLKTKKKVTAVDKKDKTNKEKDNKNEEGGFYGRYKIPIVITFVIIFCIMCFILALFIIRYYKNKKTKQSESKI